MILTKNRRKVTRFFQVILFSATIFSGLMVFGSDNLPEKPTEVISIKKGKASFYSNWFVGRKTANGEIFTQRKLTCASNVYPLGTWLRITHVKNGKSVVVKVNDRMHPRMKRIVDLTEMAAEQLGMIKAGVADVKVENLGTKKPSKV